MLMVFRALTIIVLLMLLTAVPTAAQEDASPLLPENLQVITAENAPQLEELARYGDGVLSNALAWSPDGEKLAVGGSLGVWIFETDNLAAKPQFLPHDAWVENLDWSPDGNLLAVVTRANEIHLWDLNTVADIYTIGGEHTVKFSPDGKLLAYGGQQFDGNSYFFGTVQLFDLDTKHVIAEFSFGNRVESRVTDIAFSEDGQWIAAAYSNNGTVFCFVDEGQYVGLWSLNDGLQAFQEKREITSLPDIFGYGFDVDFTQDSAYVLRNAFREVSLWSIEQLQKDEQDPIAVYTPIIQLEDGAIEKVALGGNLIATIIQNVSTAYRLELYSFDKGELLDSVPIWQGSELIFTMDSFPDAWIDEKAPPAYFGAAALEISPNGERLATLVEGELRLWDISDNRLDETDRFSLASPGLPPEIEATQRNEGFLCENFETSEGNFCGYFNQDETLFLHQKDSVYWLWDIEDGIYYSLPFPDLTRGIPYGDYYVAFSPDGKSLLIVQRISRPCSLGPGYLYELWDISGDIPSLTDFSFDNFPDALIRWSDSGPKTYDVIFSPDSQLLFTASNNGIAVWKPDDGEEIIRLTGHHGIVQRVSISDDGTLLISKGRDGTIRLWGVKKSKS